MSKITWLDWNKESFEKTKRENKPILLDISAVWCYWLQIRKIYISKYLK